MRVLILALAACLALTSCGRRGNPVPPGPAQDIIYPHVYPAPQ
jgi:predicted small lipoprotein YifL